MEREKRIVIVGFLERRGEFIMRNIGVGSSVEI